VDMSFGLTMTFMGMGVTLLTLALLILVIRLMNKIFPFKNDDEKKD
jgi:Na+-transporting methylmalonyl-CoA/oxaloacetate decarboxylase gamma subunit